MRVQTFNNLSLGEEVFRYTIDGHFSAAVEMNSYVSPEVILLRGQGRHMAARYDVAKLLGISEKQVPSALQVDEGVFVTPGTVLAEHKGKRIIAPDEGVIGVEEPVVFLYSPYVETISKSGVWGRVVYADSQGVSVKSPTVTIQGITGSGSPVIGWFKRLCPKDQLVDVTKMQDDLTDIIVYVPFNVTANGYKHLVELGAQGIITPAMRWDDYRTLYSYYQGKWPVSFVLTQGWGTAATYHYLWKLFTWAQGKRIKVMGNEHQVAFSWHPESHKGLFKGYGIHLHSQTPPRYFADLHPRDRIRLFDGREAQVIDLVDDEYVTAQVMGSKQVVSRQEITKIFPLI